MKKVFQKVKTFIAKKAIPAVAKSVPMGDTVYRIVNNIVSKLRGAGATKNVDWMVVLIQILAIAGIVYSFVKGWIPIEKFLEYLKGI